jgi:glycine betaine/proline transport system permease protein
VLAVGTGVAVYLSRTYSRFAEFPESPDLGNPLSERVTSANEWIVDTFGDLTKAFKDLVSYGLLNPLQDLIAESPWWLMSGVLLAFAYLLGGLRALVSTVVCVAIILGTGLWHDSMITLAMTLVATLMVMVLGLVFGVWMGRSRVADAAIRPVLDALQTIPPFVYLVPALALFNVGRFTAIVAAVLYASPVAIKIVADAIHNVAPTTIEAARSAGTSSGQMIRKVQLPMVRGALVLAANQGLLYVLSMVTIGALVGGGALGILVVNGFTQAEDFGKGLAAGIAITAMGIMLDRITVHSAARYGRASTQ